MRIVLITQRAPLYLAGFLGPLCSGLRQQGHEVCGAVTASPNMSRSWTAEVRSRLALYGAVDFVRMAVLIALEKLRGRTVANVLDGAGLERWAPSSVNSNAFLEQLDALDVDLILSVAAPTIFRKALLETPKYGCLNFHMGHLPRYRGRQPLFWALHNGEARVGLTVHEMTEALDAGPILVQELVDVLPDDSLHSLYQRCVARGPALVLEAVERISSGDSQRLPNDAGEATSFRFPTANDARNFRARGRSFF